MFICMKRSAVVPQIMYNKFGEKAGFKKIYSKFSSIYY